MPEGKRHARNVVKPKPFLSRDFVTQTHPLHRRNPPTKMAFVLPAALPGLTDREAIADAMYRAVQAFDTGDEAILRSALTDDVEMSFFAGGQTLMQGKGIAELKHIVFDRVGSRIDTVHYLTNVRVLLHPGADEAQATCNAIDQHCRQGKGAEAGPHRYTCGLVFGFDLVRVGDLWKAKRWNAKVIWSDGDAEVMKGEEAA